MRQSSIWRRLTVAIGCASWLSVAAGAAFAQTKSPSAQSAAPAAASPAAAIADAPTTFTFRIAMAGDSTMTDRQGYDTGFRACAADGVQILNFARGGRSSKSYYEEGLWKPVLAAKPDYVLIQFGHNDEPNMNHGAKETVPDTTYRANMTRYVDEAKAAGIKPVLVTPISRREWNKDDHRIHSSLTEYARVVREIAVKEKVPLIDLHDRAIEVYESLGERGCFMIAPLKDDGVTTDNTHMNPAGSALFGSLMAKELGDTVPELYDAFPTTKLMAMQSTQAPRAKADRAAIDAALAPAVTPFQHLGARTITVAAGGGGDFKTLQEAVAAVPANNADRTTIHIKAGKYMGQIVIPANKPNIAFHGDRAETTIVSYALTKHDPVPADVPDAYIGAGMAIMADGFHADHITFRNVAGDHGQAMAIHTEGDRGIYNDCRIVGWQDTLLINKGRQYFKDCYIEGRVDYIYGASTAVLENCEIIMKYKGYYTAASTPQDQPFGFVFIKCRLKSSNGEMGYLGRPWRPYAAVAFIDCWMDKHVWPAGWDNWRKPANEQTARYSEYNTSGPGANPAARAAWSKQLTRDEAAKYTIKNVLGGDDVWDPAAELVSLK